MSLSTVVDLLGLFGFLLAVPLAIVRIFEWWREPEFEALQGTINIRHQDEPRPHDSLWDSRFSFVAHGGDRLRHVIEWGWFIGPTNGSRVGNAIPEPLNIPIPSKESTPFELVIDQVGMSIDESEGEVEVEIRLHVDRDWQVVRFQVYRQSKNRYVTNYMPYTLRFFGPSANGKTLPRLRAALRRRLR